MMDKQYIEQWSSVLKTAQRAIKDILEEFETLEKHLNTFPPASKEKGDKVMQVVKRLNHFEKHLADWGLNVVKIGTIATERPFVRLVYHGLEDDEKTMLLSVQGTAAYDEDELDGYLRRIARIVDEFYSGTILQMKSRHTGECDVEVVCKINTNF